MKTVLVAIVALFAAFQAPAARAENGNIHAAFINKTGTNIGVRIYLHGDGKYAGPGRTIADGRRITYRKLNWPKTKNRKGTLVITTASQSLQFNFNWAGAGDNGNADNPDWIAKWRRYYIRRNNNGYFLDGPYSN